MRNKPVLRALRVLELVFDYPRSTVSQLTAEYNRNHEDVCARTIRRTLLSLVQLNYVHEYKEGPALKFRTNCQIKIVLREKI